MDDAEFIRAALREAERAARAGQCPVGAVIVRDGSIIARAGNRERELNDATAHAEILVVREAGRVLGRHKLADCTVYTTLAPCPMCEAAMLQAEIPRVVFGARSPAWVRAVRFSPERIEQIGPLMQAECRAPYDAWLRARGRSDVLTGEE